MLWSSEDRQATGRGDTWGYSLTAIVRLWVGDSPLESFRFPSLSVVGVIVVLVMLRQVFARRSSTGQSSTPPNNTR
jgi:hypothetical protein